MKKLSLISTLLVLLLTACSAASTTTTDQASTVQESTAVADMVSATQTALAPLPTLETTSISKLSTDYENAAPVAMQFAVGITQLENTDLAVTSTQAESFLTILNFLKDLSTNTSATQDQFDSLIDQAQSILTGEQIAAIANMKITQDAAMTLMGQQGGGMGNPPAQGTPPAGGPGGGQPPSGDVMGTPPAEGMQPQMGFLPPQLIDTLIQLMESKTTSS